VSIGTDSSFYEHYHYGGGRTIEFADGRMPATDHEVAIGDQVARELGYSIGSEVVITHGLYGTGIMDHDEAPFVVVGILDRTFTPVDRSLYVTLQGIDAMHEGFMEMPGAGGPGGPPPGFAPPSFAPPPDAQPPDTATRPTRGRRRA
jgi:hypothetical protein